MKQIQKLAPAKFKVTTPESPSTALELDFNPLIKEFNLSGDYLLIHWQARPKGFRQWGIYSSAEYSYRSVAELKINLAIAKSLQLDDAKATTVPSAVFHVDTASITCINERSIIGQVFLTDVAA